MSSFFHPELDLPMLKNVELVRQLMSEHAAYFMESPYPGEAERLLKSWFDPRGIRNREAKVSAQKESEENPATLETNKWEYLYHETSTLYASLKSAKHSTDEEDKMAYFRTATSLMEKLISLQERALGLKQISEHNALMMNIMERVLSPTQRNEVMDQLKTSLGQ